MVGEMQIIIQLLQLLHDVAKEVLELFLYKFETRNCDKIALMVENRMLKLIKLISLQTLFNRTVFSGQSRLDRHLM